MEKILEEIKLLKKEYPNAKYYLNFSTVLELLVAGILSAQVRDEIVNSTTPLLFKKYKKAKDYADSDLKDLTNEIKSITFANNKAKNIKAACSILVKDYNSKVPDTIEDLTKLPGIGRKTANVILQNAFNKVYGVVVDTHVIRLTQRLGWTKNKDPDKIEKDLMDKIPKQYWKEIPHLLKNHGRAVCKAPIPYCSKCFLDKLCPKINVTKRL